MKTLLVAVLLVVAACSSQPAASVQSPSPAGASPSASPSASASATVSPAALKGAYAVLIKDFLVEGGSTYTLSIVDTKGQVSASVTAHKRTTKLVQISNVSTSSTTVYYLDGDSVVRYLRPGGAGGQATTIPITSKHAAVFAVSPDDQRIAVSVLDYTKYPVGTRLYVEDLHGGGHHVELFSSTTVMEWPIGWHKGHLVIALGINEPPQNAGEWFERGSGYHVVDAQTGQRLLSLCTGQSNLEMEGPAGAVCEDYTTLKASVASWDGTTRALPIAVKPDAGSGTCYLTGPLSPAGVVATTVESFSKGVCGGGAKVYLAEASGKVDSATIAENVQPMGWIDSTHLVVDSSTYKQEAAPDLSIVDLTTLKAVPVHGSGFLAAVLPGGL